MKKQHTRHCITIVVIDQATGERRQLGEQELAERLQKVLALPVSERIKMSLHRARHSEEEKQP